MIEGIETADAPTGSSQEGAVLPLSPSRHGRGPGAHRLQNGDHLAPIRTFAPVARLRIPQSRCLTGPDDTQPSLRLATDQSAQINGAGELRLYPREPRFGHSAYARRQDPRPAAQVLARSAALLALRRLSPIHVQGHNVRKAGAVNQEPAIPFLSGSRPQPRSSSSGSGRERLDR